MNHRNMKHLFDTLSPDQNQLNKMKANIRERAVPRRNVRLHPIPIIAAILILTAGCYETFQSQIFKLVGEIMEEVGNTRIVTVAKNRLPLEMMHVMTQLAFNVA